MSIYRVTQRSMAQTSLAGLQNSLNKLNGLQQMMTSGKSISKPSDNPSGTATSMQLRTEIAQSDQYVRNAQDGAGWLSTIDTALSSATTSLQRARDLTVQGLNTGTTDQSSRDALANEVDSIGQELQSMANTTYNGRPVFGGSTTGTVAYDPTTGGYVGDTTQVSRTVGPNAKVRVDLTGPEAFGSGASSVFSVLTSISADLRSNSPTLSTDLTSLDTAMKTIQGAQSDIGARTNRLESMKQAASDRTIALQTNLSDVEDIDLPKTIMDLQLQQTAYQAALAATGKVIQPSLVDFLK